MYGRMIKNDIARNKLITLTVTLFIAAAAMLVSLAVILAVNLTGALDSMMEQAKTPHFMQMHAGELDRARLAAFAEKQNQVDEFQVVEFLNLDGSQLIFNGNSLSDSTQDHGLCVQSEQFDYLLDLDGTIIRAENGEVYVPVGYKKNHTAETGDRVLICGQEFTVAGFLRDSQMNSALSSSKRFLVSSDDYAVLKEKGNLEYLIEFRLKDLSALGDFEAAYTNAGLAANGPVVTYPLFKLLNAFSDGMMIGIILLVSLLAAAIAFLCIRFTLLAQMEDDYHEIGVMKGIGLRVSHIQNMYLMRYAVIALAGCTVGYLLSLVFEEPLTDNIRTFMGESRFASRASVLGILGVCLVFLFVTVYVKAVLHRFRRISAAEAIRLGIRQEGSGATKHLHLSKCSFINTNIFLGIRDVTTRKKLYSTILIVIILASFIQLVPQNLYHTISDKSFSTYMGIGSCDLRVDIQQTDDIPARAGEILAAMQEDETITEVNLLTTGKFRTDAGEMLKVELGDHSVFPVAYSEGRMPERSDEIALSVMNADDLSKKVGDTITLFIGGKPENLTVCGIYSDITNGGKTAKAVYSDPSAECMWAVICAKLENPALAVEKAEEYAQDFPGAKISGVDEYIAQTFGQTIDSVKTASLAAIAAALLITLLVTLLFMKMLVARDHYSIAVLKALGFTNRDITVQYLVRSVTVFILGILIGTTLANTLGEGLAGLVISSLGVSSFQFTIHPVSAYLLLPLMMICTVLIATLIGTTDAGQINISENSKE